MKRGKEQIPVERLDLEDEELESEEFANDEKVEVFQPKIGESKPVAMVHNTTPFFSNFFTSLS